MKEKQVIYILKKEKECFRFALVEICPDKNMPPFSAGISGRVPDLSFERITEEEFEQIEFACSLHGIIESVNAILGLNCSEGDIKSAESLESGRRFLRNKQSAIFLVDYDLSAAI